MYAADASSKLCSLYSEVKNLPYHLQKHCKCAKFPCILISESLKKLFLWGVFWVQVLVIILVKVMVVVLFNGHLDVIQIALCLSIFTGHTHSLTYQ